MSQEYKVEVLTPARELISTTASEVLLPTQRGEIGVLPQHEDICGLLSTGTMKLVSNNKDYWFMISGGAFRIEDGTLSILAEYAQGAETVDTQKSLDQLKKLDSELLQNANTLDQKYIILKAEKERLSASLEAARRHSMS